MATSGNLRASFLTASGKVRRALAEGSRGVTMMRTLALNLALPL